MSLVNFDLLSNHRPSCRQGGRARLHDLQTDCRQEDTFHDLLQRSVICIRLAILRANVLPALSITDKVVKNPPIPSVGGLGDAIGIIGGIFGQDDSPNGS